MCRPSIESARSTRDGHVIVPSARLASAHRLASVRSRGTMIMIPRRLSERVADKLGRSALVLDLLLRMITRIIGHKLGAGQHAKTAELAPGRDGMPALVSPPHRTGSAPRWCHRRPGDRARVVMHRPERSL